MSTIMRYGVATDPVTLEASPASGDLTKVTMTVVVSNPTDSAVLLESLTVTLPIGASGTDLTANWKDIRLVPADKWNLHNTKTSAGQVQYVFYPDPGYGSVGGEGLAFVFQNIEVNRQPGTFNVVVTEGSGGCNPASNCPEFCKLISKFPNGWGEVSFWVVPADMPYGGQVYLHWDGPAAAPPDAVTYEIEYTDQQTQKIVKIPGQNQPALPAKGQYPPKSGSGIVLQQSTEFTLNVSATFAGEKYETQLQKLVTVAKPVPTVTSFSAAWEGASLKIEWRTEHADRVEISLLHGEQERNDSISFQPSPQNPLPVSITLTATNEAGSATSTLVQQGYEQVSGSPVLVGADPMFVAVSPDGARVFVANTGSGSLTVLDTETFRPVAGSPVSIGNSPRSVAVSGADSPGGARVFVASFFGADLTVLDADGLGPVAGPAVPVGNPLSVALSPDGTRVFIANGADTSLTVVDADTLHPVARSPVQAGTSPLCVAVSGAASPGGARVFVANSLDGNLTVLEVQSLRPATGSPVRLGGGATAVAVSPDGARVFVANSANTLAALNAETLRPVAGSPAPVGNAPTSVAVSPDGARVFIANNGDKNLTVLDGETLRPVGGSPVPVGNPPRSVAVSPDGTRVFVVTMQHDTLTVLRPAAFVRAQKPDRNETALNPIADDAPC